MAIHEVGEVEMQLQKICRRVHAFLRNLHCQKEVMFLYNDVFHYCINNEDDRCELRDAIVIAVQEYLEQLSFSELRSKKKNVRYITLACRRLNRYEGPHNMNDKLTVIYSNIFETRKKEMIALVSCQKYLESPISWLPLDVIKLL